MFATVCAAFGQAVLDESQLRRFRAAEQDFAAQRYGAAAAAYEELAREVPEAAELHAKLGLSQFFNRRCDRSAPAFQRALELHPDLQAARVLLAICLSELGRYGEALPGLEEGYANPPNYPGVKRLAGLELVRSYLGLGRPAQAARVTAELQIAHPDDPEILFHANRTYREVAVQAAFEIARVAPQSVWAHQAMGEAYESRQYYDLAIMEYRRALEREPTRPGLRFRLGEAMLAEAGDASQADDALEQFELELAANPSHAASALRAGKIHHAKSELDEALGYYQRAVKLRPEFAEARVALGTLLLDTDRTAEAVRELERAVELDPTDASSRYQLARAYRKAGDMSAQRAQLAEYRRLQNERRQLDQSILLGSPQPHDRSEDELPGDSQ
ncbi:MAG: tetratricopeptide repeat protein [Acidobacteriia bacterium]|nr:tetratricopeptide repeat protein [Terriglobia bacterium]MYG03163.1 tetratricopeptide repeat protein [Terriglobia bacterium]MYK12193.1 tetratricopeptide repeat protein [Terriglobia bacterium]